MLLQPSSACAWQKRGGVVCRHTAVEHVHGRHPVEEPDARASDAGDRSLQTHVAAARFGALRLSGTAAFLLPRVTTCWQHRHWFKAVYSVRQTWYLSCPMRSSAFGLCA